MIQYCNEKNIPFLVPQELKQNFEKVIDQCVEEKMLFEAYPLLFNYLRENLKEDTKQILDYITKERIFSEKDVPEFISPNDISLIKFSGKKLIDQIFFPNRYLSSPLHLLYSKKKFPLLQKIKNHIDSEPISYKDFLIFLAEKQFEYIFKYHVKIDMVSVNIYSELKYLFNECELDALTKEQNEIMEFFEPILYEIHTNVKNKIKSWIADDIKKTTTNL